MILVVLPPLLFLPLLVCGTLFDLAMIFGDLHPVLPAATPAPPLLLLLLVVVTVIIIRSVLYCWDKHYASATAAASASGTEHPWSTLQSAGWVALPKSGADFVWRDLVMVCWSSWEEADWYEPLNMEPIVCLK